MAKTNEPTEEAVLSYLGKNPGLAIGFVGSLTFAEVITGLAGSSAPAEGGEEEGGEEEGGEEEGGEEEGGEEEGGEEEGGEEEDRAFPTQDAIKALKEPALKKSIKETFGIDPATVANPRKFVSICAAIYEEEDRSEFTRDDIKAVAKAFGIKIMTADTPDTLSAKISEKLNEIFSDGEEDGEDGEGEEGGEEESIAEQLNQVKGAAASAKATASGKKSAPAGKKGK